MCSPTAAVSGGMQLGASYSAAESGARMTGIRNRALTSSAQNALDIDQKILLRQASEQGDKFSQRSFDIATRSRELASEAIVAAGESGVSGNSVKAQQRKIKFQEGQIAVRSKKSYDSVMATIADNNTKAINNMVARMNNLPPVNTPSLLATALNVGAGQMTGTAADKFDGWFKETFPA